MRHAALLAAIALAVASAGCHKSAAAAVPTITITPTDIDLQAGTSEQFGDTITNESTSAVTWLVNGIQGGSNNGFGTISTTGLYQAPTTPPNAVVVITVEVTADTATAAEAAIVITATPVVTLLPTSATLAASAPPVAFPFTVTLFGLNTNPPTSPNVTWEVNNVIGGNSVVGTIDQMGNYTPPQVPPPGGTVFVQVYLDADTTQSAGATVTLTYGAASAQGSYAFQLAGQNGSGFFARAGQMTFDGVSAISGVEDVHNAGGAAAPEANITGNYTVGVDGRGTATLSDGTNYYLAVVSANQIKLVEANSFATARGQADLQTAASFSDSSFTGNYAFDFFGTSGAANPTSEIGQFNATGAGATIQNGLQDVNAGGTLTPATGFSGNFGAINTATGRGTATINGGVFSFYMISTGQALFIETDASANVLGSAFQQTGTANAGYLSSLTVFTIAGRSTTGKTAAAGLFLADGSGGSPTSISGGLLDENANGTVTPSLQFTGTYSVASSGRGTMSFTPSGQPAMSFVIYFTAAGQGFIQETDSSTVGDGQFVSQRGLGGNFSTASLVGTFAINWTGAAPPTVAQQDATGQLTVGKTLATVSGTWDRNDALVLAPKIALTGTYFLAVNGRGTVTLMDAGGTTYDLAAYVANTNTVFLVGTDPALVFSGQLTRQF